MFLLLEIQEREFIGGFLWPSATRATSSPGHPRNYWPLVPRQLLRGMIDSIYVRKGTEQFGPYNQETLLTLLKDGHFTLQDLGWHETAGDWKPLAQIFNLKPEAAAAPARATVPVTLAASPAEAMGPRTEVVITGVQMRFVDMIVLILKIWLASIPAMILIWVLMMMIMLIFSALFGSLFFLHHQ